MLSTFHWNRIVPNVSSSSDSTTQHTTIQQPLGRHGHTMVNYKNKLYLFGGHNGSTSSNDLYIYDIENNSWVEANTQGISPAPRYLHSAAVINDTMYIFGGARWLDTTNDLHLLNLETLTWTQPETKGTPPEILCSHSAFAKGNKLIIFGGLATRKMKFSNDVYTLDTRDFTWTREDTSGYSIPKKGYKASALVGNSLYVFSRTLFPVGLETHILDLNSMTWVQVATNGPYPELECFTACAIGTTIVVCGGKELSSPYSGNSRAVNDVFSLCSRTLSWSLLSSPPSPPSPSDGFPARYGHSACTANGRMYVFGGRSGYPKNLDDLFSFSWHQIVPSLIDICLTKIVDQTPSDPHSLSPYLFSLSALPEDLFLLVFQRMAQHRKLTLSTLSLFLKNPSFLSCVTFSLSDCGNVVDDDWLHTIAQISSAHSQRWEILDISNCKLVSNKGLRKLTGLPNLKTLLADADSKITYEGVKMFKDHLPNVDVVLCRQSTPLYKVS